MNSLTGILHLNPVEFIRTKRDGRKLSAQEIESFIQGTSQGTIPDYQVTAFLMATYFRGMDEEETTALTTAIIHSGRQIKFTDQRPKVDKHSTGGVGDKVSLVLAPLVASLGVDVPMVAGRALGHTGGTLDKLESIPGFRVRLKVDEFIDVVSKTGVAIIGQSEEFVPADKLLYALRDVTATVECIPLMTASILSKKVAEGITGLVLDIKYGSGAFMRTQKDAERLAKLMVSVGKKLGLKIRACLTDMSQPLGYAIGNSIEVLECLDVLEGKGPTDLRSLTIELAAHMLVLGGKSSSLSAARTMARQNLINGVAMAKFNEMCRAQGSTLDATHLRERLVLSNTQFEFKSPKSGFITKIDTLKLGMLACRMGCGRQKTTDTIDHSVGIRLNAKYGAQVKKDMLIATLFYNPQKTKLTTQHLEKEFTEIFTITNQKVSVVPLVKKVIE